MHISPFNFPLEIPVLQLMGALITGNKITVKVDSRVSLVIEQFVRLLIECGLPPSDLDLIHSNGINTEKFIRMTPEIRMLQFTGSSTVAERLSQITNGKIKIEDAGLNWKILGPGVLKEIDYIAWQSDHDAYTLGGQKCSAQSILFAHEDWIKAGFIEKIKAYAEKRTFETLSIVPILTWSNKRIQSHVDAVLKIPGSRLLFGGEAITNTKVPEQYGLYKPTAIVNFRF